MSATVPSTVLSPLAPRAAPAPPRVGGVRGAFELLGAAYDRLVRHAGDSLAGGLAFGAVLSIAPLLLVVVAVASLVLGANEAASDTVRLVGDSLGDDARGLVAQWVMEAQAWSGGATAVGVVMFVYGAGRLVRLVDDAFEIVFEVPPRPKMRFADTVKLWLKTQATSAAVTLGAGLVLSGSLVLRGLAAAFLPDGRGPAFEIAWAIGSELLSIALWFGAMAIVYAVLPPVKLSRSDVVLGAGISALLVEIPLLVLRLLASYVDFGAAYGAAGALIGVLVTLSIVGQLFLFGAEITAERAERRDGAPKDRLTDRRSRCMKVMEGKGRGIAPRAT